MDIVVEKGAGIDVHQEKLAINILIGAVNERPISIDLEYGTTVPELRTLGDYLKELGVTHVYMESTSQFWVPVYKILMEYNFVEVIVANPQRIKGIPGRKRDVTDAQWIAKLGRVGLIPSSYVPEQSVQDLRRLTRTRTKIAQDKTQKRNRIHNILQQANIKLTTYLTNIFGVTGVRLMNLLVTKEEITVDKIESLKHKKVKATSQELFDAMQGSFSEVQLEELEINLTIISTYEAQLKKLNKLIEDKTSHFQATIDELLKIPGVGKQTVQIILAEVGFDVDSFKTFNSLCKWVGLAPGDYESAGKSKSGKTVKGNKYLRSALIMAGKSAGSSGSPKFSNFHSKITNKSGKQKANVATARKILKIVYIILRDKVDYNYK